MTVLIIFQIIIAILVLFILNQNRQVLNNSISSNKAVADTLINISTNQQSILKDVDFLKIENDNKKRILFDLQNRVTHLENKYDNV